MNKLPISAIVVGLNEGHLLSACLQSILFCDEIIYYDLGSTDNSIEIAQIFCTKIIENEKAKYVEIIHSKYANQTKNNWILITDPDEVVDLKLYLEIKKLFLDGMLAENIGAVIVPCYYYFKNIKLLGTIWGGQNSRILLAHNKRFTFSKLVHVGRNIIPPFTMLQIKDFGFNGVHHYWMQSYKQLINKHTRYLENEGEARYKNGIRTSISNIFFEPYKSFKLCFLTSKGYLDGLNGFYLSCFWAWYNTKSLINLYKFQNIDNKLSN